MKIGHNLPANFSALAGSEIKYGYDKPIANREYRYIVEGDRLTFREICERLPSLLETTVRSRLAKGYSHTWAVLGCSPTEKRSAASKQGCATRARQRANGKTYQRIQREENRARRIAATAGHKPL